jgi:outer membrane protein assembly factor BamD (BamD/ComL family)
MSLLSRGQAALNAGDYQNALGAFDEHRTRFPLGALASERELKRIATLCRMGRKAEARAAAERYAKRHPGSPSAEKARRICGEAP